MAYTKTNWVNDQTELSADNMNKIEDGIAKSYTVNLIAISDTAPTTGFEVGDRYFNTTDGYIYVAINQSSMGWVIDLNMQAETGVLYTILDTQKLYAYDGETMVSVGGGGGGGIAVYPDEPEEDTKLYIEEEDLDGQYLPVEEDIYSTTETKTNKVWIDGKPIYRKVFNVNSPSSTDTNTNIGSIGAFDTLVSITGNIYLNETYGVIPIPQSVATTNMTTIFLDNKANGNVMMKVQNSVYSSKPTIVIVEYTKTS